MAGLPSPLMEATVQDPAVDALGFLRVEIDNRPGVVEPCPWAAPFGGTPLPGDAAAVIESDGGHFWALWWPQNGQPDGIVHQTYTPAAHATDRVFNPAATTLGEVANVLATLIDDLKGAGVIVP